MLLYVDLDYNYKGDDEPMGQVWDPNFGDNYNDDMNDKYGDDY